MTSVLQRAWLMRGLWLGPCGLALAFLGTLLLAYRGYRWLGAGLIIVGCVLAVVAWRRVPLPSPFGASQDVEKGKPRYSKYVPALVGFALTALCSMLASVAYVGDRSPTFGVAGWLWLISMGLLPLSCLLWPREAESIGTEDADKWPGWEKLTIVLLVALATGLRLWNLNNFPFFVFGDETETGRIALQSYGEQSAGGAAPSIFSLLWTGIDLPGLWFLTVAKSVEFGGGELWGLRMPAALFGSAMAIPLYGFVRSGWGRGAAIAGTAMFAFNAVAVHYSRVTLNNIVTPFFWAVCFLFLLRGLRTRRPLDWALAGLAGGLSEYFYYGTRLLPFILVLFFGYLLVTNRGIVRSYAVYFGMVMFGYVVAFGPLLARYVANPSLYTGRAEGWLSWDHVPVDWADFGRMIDTLGPIIRDNVLGISTLSSQDLFYYASLLLPAEGALLFVGVTLLAVRWRHPASFLALVSMVGVVLTGGTLVVYAAAPALNHWTPAFPAIYAALAVPIGAWLATSGGISRGWKVAVKVFLAVLLLVIGYININFYFREYHTNPERLTLEAYRDPARLMEVRSAQAHFQRELGPDYMVRFLGDDGYLQNPVVPWLIKGQDYGPIRDPLSTLPIRRRPGMGLAFVMLPGGEEYRDLVRGLYPGGSDGEVFSGAGRHLFYTYVLGP